jgi:hypothetical protein
VSIDPVDSDWEAATFGLNGQWTSSALASNGVVARLSGGWHGSLTDTEQWTSDGDVLQRNDLDLYELDLQAELGRPFLPARSTVWTPWCGVGIRRLHFERSRFRSGSGESLAPDSVSEDFDLGYLSLALDVEHALNDAWVAVLRANVAYVFYYDAENSVWGSLEGEDGRFYDVDAGLRCRLSATLDLGFGVIYAYQELEGAVETHPFPGPGGSARVLQVELPDNEFEQLLFYASLRMPL